MYDGALSLRMRKGAPGTCNQAKSTYKHGKFVSSFTALPKFSRGLLSSRNDCKHSALCYKFGQTSVVFRQSLNGEFSSYRLSRPCLDLIRYVKMDDDAVLSLKAHRAQGLSY